MVDVKTLVAAAGSHKKPAETTFQPLSQRLRGAPLDETLFDGVPKHLDAVLRNWIRVSLNEASAIRVCLRLRLEPSGPRDLAFGVSESSILDIIDAMLWLGFTDYVVPAVRPTLIDPQYKPAKTMTVAQQLVDLETILEDGGSAYRVSTIARGLETRVDATATEAARMAIQSAGRVGRTDSASLLRDAWVKTYGLSPDAGESYADSIKAVEAVACPLFLPRDNEPTLGKVKSYLESASAKYELAIADRSAQPAPIDTAVKMVGLLWHGQRERHAGGPTTAAITQEAAEMALHLAVVLVQWFSTGTVRRK